jgi:hypothetical protein
VDVGERVVVEEHEVGDLAGLDDNERLGLSDRGQESTQEDQVHFHVTSFGIPWVVRLTSKCSAETPGIRRRVYRPDPSSWIASCVVRE